MKKVFLAALLFSSVAFAAVNLYRSVVIFKGGIKIGGTGSVISDSYSGSSSIDFAGVTDDCEDSSGITITGAATGDLCMVGPPATMASAGSWITCYVSAANTVKVRHCAHGASGNPAAATYYIRVMDP